MAYGKNAQASQQRLPVRFSKLNRAKLLADGVECCGAIAESYLRGIAKG